MTLEVGQLAPDFSLNSTEDDPINLADYRGESNVLLLFFPFAFSGVCTDEFCSLRDNHDQYTGLDAQILGISGDSLHALNAWKAQENFPFPLLSDFNHEVTPAYGAHYDELAWMKDVPKRAAFVIDKKGVVRYAEVLATPGKLPDFEAVRAILADLS